MAITIFTDGASRGNPGPGGWGAIVVTDEKVTELGGGENNTTNNRMELQAAIGALSSVSTLRHPRPGSGPGVNSSGDPGLKENSDRITIYTDSSYVLKGATKWLSGWQESGWQTKAKKEVLNRDLWQELARTMSGKNISWQLLSGHVGVVGNERADGIATAFADGTSPKLFSGPTTDYGLRTTILDISHDATQKADRSSDKTRSRAVAYSYVSKVNGEIKIHKTWAECEKRVKGVRGSLYKKVLSPDEEKEIVKNFESR